MKKVTRESSISDIVGMAVSASNNFEGLGETEGAAYKRRYIQNIYNLYRQVGRSSNHALGMFTTGYPGYNLALSEIGEQYRYNHELLKQIKELGIESMTWKCGGCLMDNYHKMPNLKQICYPCQSISDAVKPRKIINRLPDLDVWFVYDDAQKFFQFEAETNAIFLSHEIERELAKRNLYTSDVDPIRTINDMYEISESLKKFTIPKTNLPVDVHLVGINYLKNLIQSVPEYMVYRLSGEPGELKINPYSLRKTWEFDEAGYNYIFDFLLSFTVVPLKKEKGEYDYVSEENELISLVNETRKLIVNHFDVDEIYSVLQSVSGLPAKRRLETQNVQDEFLAKLLNWKNGDYEKDNWILEEPDENAPIKI